MGEVVWTSIITFSHQQHSYNCQHRHSASRQASHGAKLQQLHATTGSVCRRRTQDVVVHVQRPTDERQTTVAILSPEEHMQDPQVPCNVILSTVFT